MNTTNKPLISIIIPVYNVEKYLEQCITSVLTQTYTNFEVIIVDDGSTDGSPLLCDKFAQNDTRVSVIHKKNGGLSDARNTGLSLSNGEFLFFLDSDDFWRNKNDLEQIVDFARSKDFNFTFIEINRSRFLPSTGKFYNLPIYPKTLVNRANKNQIIIELVSKGLFPMSACTKLLNRRFLVDNNIFFIKRIFSEDIPWFMSILKYAKAPIYYTNQYMYGNRGEVATSLTSTFTNKKFLDVLDIVEKGVANLDNSGLEYFTPEAIQHIKSFYAYRICIMMGQAYKFRHQISLDEKTRLKKMMYLLEYTENPKVRKVYFVRNIIGDQLCSMLLSKYLLQKDSIKKHH